MRFVLLLPLLLASCQAAKQDAVVVDISDQELCVRGYCTDIETSRVGTGTALGSNRTPLGTYTLTREPGHRYGKTLRLSGYQGKRRGILIHRDFRSGDGTSGCICPTTRKAMERVYDLTPTGTELIVRR